MTKHFRALSSFLSFLLLWQGSQSVAQQKSLLLKNISENPFIPTLTRDVCRQQLGKDMFCAPEGSAISIAGNHAFLFVSDRSWNRVIWMDVLRSAAGDGTYELTSMFGSFGTGLENLYAPRGLATDNDVNGDGYVNLYMVDTENNRIMRRRVALLYVPAPDYFYSLAQAVLTTQLSKPVDVEFSSNGTPTDTLDDYLWIVDQGSHRLVRCNANIYETVLGTYGSFGNGTGQFSTPSGVAAARDFQNPNADLKKIYISDEGNRRIVELSSPNDWSTINWRIVFQGSDSSDFTGVAVDGHGFLWVIDHGSDEVIKIKPSNGQMIARISGSQSGPSNYSGLHSIATVHGQAWADLFVTEHWSSNTGGRWHRIGVDVTNSIGASPWVQGQCNSMIGFNWVITDPGYLDVKVYRRPNTGGIWLVTDTTSIRNYPVVQGPDYYNWVMPCSLYGKPYTYKLEAVIRSTYQNVNGTPVNSDTLVLQLAQPMWDSLGTAPQLTVQQNGTARTNVLSWTDPFIRDKQWAVHRKLSTDPIGWNNIGYVDSNVITFSDDQCRLNRTVSFDYRVRAFDPFGGRSPWSNTSTASASNLPARGDLNGDFNFTATDVVLMLECIFATGNCDICFADLNCDGLPTGSDVVNELRLVFLEIAPPCLTSKFPVSL